MTYFNDDDEDDIESLRQEAREMLIAINAVIAVNKDDRTKEIGDRVVIWDGSANIDKNTKQHRMGIDPLFKNNKAIVIKTNCDVKYEDEMMKQIIGRNYTKLCDLLLVFPSGEEVYCDSSMVRIID